MTSSRPIITLPSRPGRSPRRLAPEATVPVEQIAYDSAPKLRLKALKALTKIGRKPAMSPTQSNYLRPRRNALSKT